MTDFDEFWSIYPADLCRGAKNKGGKTKAKESWEKHVTDPQMVVSALQAQIRYDRDAKNKGEDVMRWPFASTWLNQARWDVEIESHADLQQRHEAKYCHCGKETHGPRFDKCAEHMEYDFDPLRDYYRKHPEVHGLTGHDAANWIRNQIRGIGK